MNKKILLIEDDPIIIRMYKIQLKKSGYEVAVAGTGKEGLEKSSSEKPDLIVLDLVLPEMDGFKVLEKIKNNPQTKHIPVVVLSNLGKEANIQRGVDLGASAYLIKAQLKPSQVLEKIKQILNSTKN